MSLGARLATGFWVLSSAGRLGFGFWARPGGRVLGFGETPENPCPGEITCCYGKLQARRASVVFLDGLAAAGGLWWPCVGSKGGR